MHKLIAITVLSNEIWDPCVVADLFEDIPCILHHVLRLAQFPFVFKEIFKSVGSTRASKHYRVPYLQNSTSYHVCKCIVYLYLDNIVDSSLHHHLIEEATNVFNIFISLETSIDFCKNCFDAINEFSKIKKPNEQDKREIK